MSIKCAEYTAMEAENISLKEKLVAANRALEKSTREVNALKADKLLLEEEKEKDERQDRFFELACQGKKNI
jgi:hypothetical protein